jgi:prephenate dehydrogenase
MVDAQSPLFDCLAIVGVGLMGGSLGLAAREKRLAYQVIGIDPNGEALTLAVERGAIDAGATNLDAAQQADGIVLAAPVSAIPPLLEALAPSLRPDALVTDLGSVKTRIVETGRRLLGPRFVGGHPMAGSERSGIGAARADLFAGAAWAVVLPKPFTFVDDEPAARWATFAEALGARPIPLDAARHDRLVALVSHLPHLLSFAYARAVAADSDAEAARRMAGGSYRDLMRVSAAAPALWRDIFTENRAALLDACAAYETRLQALRAAITDNDSERLRRLLEADPRP